MDKELKIKTEEKLKDEAKKASPLSRHKKKIFIFLPLLLIAMGGAYYYLTMQVSDRIPEVKNVTLEEHADEKMELSEENKEEDILKAVEKPEHFYRIQEKNYLLTPQKNIRYAKITFILQAAKEKDLDNIEKNEPLIMETLNNILRRSTPSDFEGAAGKEAMRAKILKGLNEKLDPPLINLRYGSLFLHH
jgi:flagellar basal body-associated protein FliL